jgi:hypothetical protein
VLIERQKPCCLNGLIPFDGTHLIHSAEQAHARFAMLWKGKLQSLCRIVDHASVRHPVVIVDDRLNGTQVPQFERVNGGRTCVTMDGQPAILQCQYNRLVRF